MFKNIKQFALPFIASIFFSFIFKWKQLAIAMINYQNYPTNWFLTSVLTTVLILTILFFVNFFLIDIVSVKDKFKKTILAGIPFLSLFIFYLPNSNRLTFIVYLTLLLLVLLRECWLSLSWDLLKIEIPAIFICNLVLMTLFFKSLSPLYHFNFFTDMAGRLDAILPLELQWEKAIALDIGTFFNQKVNLGDVPIYPFSVSEILSLVHFIFDIPVANLFQKFAVMKFYYFALLNFGFLGAYILFRKGFSFTIFLSFFGALGFIYGNSVYIGYLDNESFHHFSEYLFLPWSFYFLLIAYKNKSFSYAFLAGLIMSVATYFMRSAVESIIIHYLFINIMNLYFFVTNKETIKQKFLILIGLPLGIFLGVAYAQLPIFGGIYSNNFMMYQPHEFYGLDWKNPLVYFASLFHKFDFGADYVAAPSDVGAHAGFYRGQVINLIMIYFLVKLFFERSKRFTFEIFLFCLIGLLFYLLQFGSSSLLSIIMNYFEVGRIHFSTRVLVIYHFIVTMTSVFALKYFIDNFNFKNNIRIIGFYFVLFFTSYFFHQGKINYFFQDFSVLIGSIVLLSLIAKKNGTWTKILFLMICFYSFVNQNEKTLQLMDKRKTYENNPEIYTSLRSSFSEYSYSSHQYKSLKYLKSKLNLENNQNIKLEDLKDLVEKFDKDSLHNKEILKLESLNKNITGNEFAENLVYMDKNNSLNFYFPDYTRIIYTFKREIPIFVGTGKTFDVATHGIYSFSGSPIYPSLNTFFYFSSFLGQREKDGKKIWFNPKVDLSILKNEKVRKIFNIIGVDRIVFNELDYPWAKNELSSFGYIVKKLEDLDLSMAVNPLSSGIAFVANRVSFIDPKENLSNFFSYIKFKSPNLPEELYLNFDQYLSKISDEKYSVVLEKALDSEASRLGVNSIKIDKIVGNRAKFSVECENDCWMVYNNAFLKGWHAFDESKEVEIVKANYGFMGISLKSGNHNNVWFEYRDKYEILGLFTVLLSWVLVMICLYYKKDSNLGKYEKYGNL